MEITKQEYEVYEFMASFCNWGFRDVKRALAIAKECGLDTEDAVEVIEDFVESTCCKDFSKLDVCWIILDHCFQMARNEIDNVLEIDLCNDLGFDTYSNYMCSSIDYSEEHNEELLNAFKEASRENIELLLENDFVLWFLDEVELLEDVKALVADSDAVFEKIDENTSIVTINEKVAQ